MDATVPRRRVIIMGAAGRDFHNFNVVYRDDERYEVVAFTATQIPGIEGRTYPRDLAGRLYPDGIPIFPEADLDQLIQRFGVDQVDFAYSDIAHVDVMHKASRVLAAGADFSLVGPKASMLESDIPVIAACAVRTGAGKSQTTRAIARILNRYGKKIAAIRHPMPYGDLVKMRMQRFDSYDDLAAADCTIEEREEYEPHLAQGSIVYAGVDYEEILRNAEKEADVILWDGGNNDFSFYRPDLNITVADPLRAGHEMLYHPGETNLRMADVVIINKVDSALRGDVLKLRETIGKVNPTATIVEARSTIKVEDDTPLEGRRVLVVEDGPTLTHGEMGYGAGVVLARRAGATLVDPRPWAAGSIKDVYSKFPHIGALLPAMGYSPEQRKDLEDTINASDADIVLIGSPIDLRSICDLNKPAVRVFYELEDVGEPSLETIIKERLGLSDEGGA